MSSKYFDSLSFQFAICHYPSPFVHRTSWDMGEALAYKLHDKKVRLNNVPIIFSGCENLIREAASDMRSVLIQQVTVPQHFKKVISNVVGAE